MLRKNISVVAEGVLIIAEEFAEWEDSKRRIDLLGVDRDGTLVVIELKRDDDGGHMELQAIRYAAMLSGMTFDRAADVFQAYMDRTGVKGDASALLLEHIEGDEDRKAQFAQESRIVLVSQNFSKELTTTALWLNKCGLDICCVRLRPHTMGTEMIVEVQQIVPLPEAEQYTIQLKKKAQAAKDDKAERFKLRTAFWKQLLPACAKVTPRFSGLTPGDDCWIGATAGLSGLRYVYLAWMDRSAAELYIDRGAESESENKAIFKYLEDRKAEIEKAFGGPLSWERLGNRRASRVRTLSLQGGVESPQSQWADIQSTMMSTMARFEKAIGPHLAPAIASVEK